MSIEIVSVNYQAEARTVITLRNLPDGKSFTVGIAVLRQMANQTARGREDRELLRNLLKKLDTEGNNENSRPL